MASTRGVTGRFKHAVGLMLVVSAGCATTGPETASPSEANAGEACPLLIENGTGVSLELTYQTRSQRIPVGVLGPGSSQRIAVACDADRHWVAGTSVDASAAGRDQFRAGIASLDPAEETLVRITARHRLRPGSQ